MYRFSRRSLLRIPHPVPLRPYGVGWTCFGLLLGILLRENSPQTKKISALDLGST